LDEYVGGVNKVTVFPLLIPVDAQFLPMEERVDTVITDERATSPARACDLAPELAASEGLNCGSPKTAAPLEVAPWYPSKLL
jgi:hypothetical protein